MRKTTTYHYSEGDVRQFVKDELKETNTKIDSLSDKFDEFKNKAYELLDKVLGELKTIREEQIVMAAKQSEHTNTLEDHETRIEKLEQVINP